MQGSRHDASWYRSARASGVWPVGRLSHFGRGDESCKASAIALLTVSAGCLLMQHFLTYVVTGGDQLRSARLPSENALIV